MASSDGTWHRVMGSDEVPEGGLRAATAGGCPVVVSRVGGKLGAVGGICPHKGGPLAEAAIENGLLVCPWHGYEFDPCTGESPSFALPATAYPVEARADGIYVFVAAGAARG